MKSIVEELLYFMAIFAKFQRAYLQRKSLLKLVKNVAILIPSCVK